MNNNDLFPFPGQNQDEDETLIKPDLPAFPPASADTPGLAADEIKTLRQIIELFKHDDLGKLLKQKEEGLKQSPQEPLPASTSPQTLSEKASTPAGTAIPEYAWREAMFKQLDSAAVTEVWEVESRGAFKQILQAISSNSSFIKVWSAIAGIFPVKKCLRHGTPDQKRFALMAISERFLESLSGELFPDRKRLLKVAGAYFSAASEHYNFIAMESDNFSPQYHEKAPGSSATGRTIREMHSFVVVDKNSNLPVSKGLVLT